MFYRPTDLRRPISAWLLLTLAACGGSPSPSQPVTEPAIARTIAADQWDGRLELSTPETRPSAIAQVVADVSPSGELWVAWAGDVRRNPGIYVRSVAPDGQLRAGPVQVTTDNEAPAIAVDALGNAVIAWRQRDGQQADVVFSRLPADGGAPSAPQIANPLPGLLDLSMFDALELLRLTEGPMRPQIAMSPDGRFVISWVRNQTAIAGFFPVGPLGGGINELQARRFAASGEPDGLPFTVSTDIPATNMQRLPLAMDAQGRVVFSWWANELLNGGLVATIFVRRYDANGRAEGGREVLEGSEPPVILPTVSRADDGRYAIAWRQGGAGSRRLLSRVFDAEGFPLSTTQIVTEDGGDPLSASAPTGEFIVAWSQSLPVSSLDESALVGRCFDRDGLPRGAEFPISQNTRGRARDAAVAVDGFGRVWAAWSAQDLDSNGRFEDPVIRLRRLEGC